MCDVWFVDLIVCVDYDVFDCCVVECGFLVGLGCDGGCNVGFCVIGVFEECFFGVECLWYWW